MDNIDLDTTLMALQRTEMGAKRTFMGLERTLMAWVRTSMSLMSFGFTIFKFLDVMGQKGGGNLRENSPRNLGLFLIVLGMTVLGLAIYQFMIAKNAIQEFADVKPQFSVAMIASIGILLVGVFMILNILAGVGNF